MQVGLAVRDDDEAHVAKTRRNQILKRLTVPPEPLELAALISGHLNRHLRAALVETKVPNFLETSLVSKLRRTSHSGGGPPEDQCEDSARSLEHGLQFVCQKRDTTPVAVRFIAVAPSFESTTSRGEGEPFCGNGKSFPIWRPRPQLSPVYSHKHFERNLLLTVSLGQHRFGNSFFGVGQHQLLC